MTDSPTATSAGRFEVRATADIHFGWIRTRLSVERTMMSWQRTAPALIGFGFAIAQYLEHLQQVPGSRSAYFPEAPQLLGLALISCGILALVISLCRYLSARGFARGDQVPIAAISASTPKILIIRLRL